MEQESRIRPGSDSMHSGGYAPPPPPPPPPPERPPPPFPRKVAPTEPFSGWHALAKKLRFQGDLRKPPGTLGPLLGCHLVTTGVCVNPWGAM